jgi:hypothetical protein
MLKTVIHAMRQILCLIFGQPPLMRPGRRMTYR